MFSPESIRTVNIGPQNSQSPRILTRMVNTKKIGTVSLPWNRATMDKNKTWGKEAMAVATPLMNPNGGTDTLIRTIALFKYSVNHSASFRSYCI